MQRILAIALMLTYMAGCTGSTDSSQGQADRTAASGAGSANGQETAGQADPPPPVLINEVEVSQADFGKLDSAIQSFHGRVVVVDIWSTSCLPCMKEFPNLVKLAGRWPEELVCISLNVDYTGLPTKPIREILPKAKEFLVKVSASPSNMMNLVCSEPDEHVFTKFEIEALPAILVYDQQGKLVKKLTVDTAGEDGLTYESDVVPLVEQLMKANAEGQP